MRICYCGKCNSRIRTTIIEIKEIRKRKNELYKDFMEWKYTVGYGGSRELCYNCWRVNNGKSVLIENPGYVPYKPKKHYLHS